MTISFKPFKIKDKYDDVILDSDDILFGIKSILIICFAIGALVGIVFFAAWLGQNRQENLVNGGIVIDKITASDQRGNVVPNLIIQVDESIYQINVSLDRYYYYNIGDTFIKGK